MLYIIKNNIWLSQIINININLILTDEWVVYDGLWDLTVDSVWLLGKLLYGIQRLPSVDCDVFII